MTEDSQFVGGAGDVSSVGGDVEVPLVEGDGDVALVEGDVEVPLVERAKRVETRRLLLASRNAKKLKELRRVVAAAGLAGLDVVGLDDVPSYPEEPETGATFEENALIKARSGAKATGLPCVADDSGIAVDALNGMPGVLSARWSGGHGDDQANNDLLLAQLSDVPAERRAAAFVSACALVLPDGTETVVRGEWRGVLLSTPKGDNGFGYDPLFAPDDDAAAGRSSAELSPEEKDALSHRGKALAQLVPALRGLGE